MARHTQFRTADFWVIFHGNFIYPQSYCLNSARLWKYICCTLSSKQVFQFYSRSFFKNIKFFVFNTTVLNVHFFDNTRLLIKDWHAASFDWHGIVLHLSGNFVLLLNSLFSTYVCICFYCISMYHTMCVFCCCILSLFSYYYLV